MKNSPRGELFGERLTLGSDFNLSRFHFRKG